MNHQSGAKSDKDEVYAAELQLEVAGDIYPFDLSLCLAIAFFR
jgi:hypothetical protein